jgi:predicted metal-dependent hydrolase
MDYITIAESKILTEARDPARKYSEKEVKKQVERVTVELDGSEAGVFTRLGRRWEKLDIVMKRMKEASEAVKDTLRDRAENLFDAEDVVITRVVQTSAVILTLSKKAKEENPIKVDYEKIAAELAKMISKDLQPEVERIYGLYTEIVEPKEKKTPLKVQVTDPGKQVDEGLKELGKRAVQAIVKKFADVRKTVLAWAVTYDRKLAAIKTQLK